MNEKLMNVTIGFQGKPVDVIKVQETFGGAGWARYAPNCWLIFSSEEPQAIVERIRAICSPNDNVLVVKIDPDRGYGFLPKEIWDWLKSRV